LIIWEERSNVRKNHYLLQNICFVKIFLIVNFGIVNTGLEIFSMCVCVYFRDITPPPLMVTVHVSPLPLLGETQTHEHPPPPLVRVHIAPHPLLGLTHSLLPQPRDLGHIIISGMFSIWLSTIGLIFYLYFTHFNNFDL
jgi:hypothetical protein